MKEMLDKIKGDVLAIALILSGAVITLKSSEKELGKSLVTIGATHLGTK